MGLKCRPQDFSINVSFLGNFGLLVGRERRYICENHDGFSVPILKTTEQYGVKVPSSPSNQSFPCKRDIEKPENRIEDECF